MRIFGSRVITEYPTAAAALYPVNHQNTTTNSCSCLRQILVD